MGFSGRCEAIKAPTTENDTIWVRRMTVVGIPVSTISYRVCPLRRLKIRHAPASATHSTHSDQASHEAGRALIPLTPRPFSLPLPSQHHPTVYRRLSIYEMTWHELRELRGQDSRGAPAGGFGSCRLTPPIGRGSWRGLIFALKMSSRLAPRTAISGERTMAAETIGALARRTSLGESVLWLSAHPTPRWWRPLPAWSSPQPPPSRPCRHAGSVK